MRNTERTFHWIINILHKHQAPFVFTGGFAAKIYGSPRELNDIDIDLFAKYFEEILEDIRPYITYGPDHYTDERWDLQLITLNHEGQQVDLSGGDTIRIRDARTGQWKDMSTNFSSVEQKEVFGLTVPIISREDLIKYKSMLTGDHQKVDVAAAQKI